MTEPRRRPLRARRVVAAAAVLFAAVLGGPDAGASPGWRSRPERPPTQYKIQAELLTKPGEDAPRLLTGRETIVWTNAAREPVSTLLFHVYANAWRDEGSAFVREMKRDGRELPERMVWGGTDIQSVTQHGSVTGRQPTWEYVPFEDAPEDRTVLRVKLPQPVESGGQVLLEVWFTTELPKPVARMGASGDFVMAAQWFPKLGRHVGPPAPNEPPDPRLVDGWNCHHYHANAEFAGEFADYDVTLTVPESWTVGATGAPVGEAVPGTAAGTSAPTVTRTWTARNVVDFAWTAGRRFREVTRTIDPDDPAAEDGAANEIRVARRLLRLADGEDDLPPVEVVLLLQPEHADQAERHFEAARVALGLFGTWLGPYPYPRLTIVDPPHGVPVGGMEYPTLVTAGTSVGSPPAARRVEHVVVHEIGHQWFMNLLANDEALEAWLDEGLTTWFTARAMDVAWGPPAQHTSVLGAGFDAELPYTFPGVAAGWPEAFGLPSWARPPAIEAFRLWRDGPALLGSAGLRYRDDQSPFLPARRSYLRSAGSDPLVKPGWEYVSGDSYRGNAYPRSVLLLETIARHVRRAFDRPGDRDGERRVVRAFREYARQHRFGHPTTADLLRVLRRETELPEIDTLFTTLARTSGLLDYRVDSVRTTESKRPDGTPDVRSEVQVRRRGEVVVPVTVRFAVEGADAPVDVAWDGADRWRRFSVPGRVRSVTVDPDRLFLQDANLSDNVWADRRSEQPAVKWGVHFLLWAENALAAYGRFF